MDFLVYYFKLVLRWFFDPLYSRTLLLVSLSTKHDKRIAFSQLPQRAKDEIEKLERGGVNVLIRKDGKLCISDELVYFNNMRVLPDNEMGMEVPTISIESVPFEVKMRIYLATPRSTTLNDYDGKYLSILAGHAYYNGQRVIE